MKIAKIETFHCDAEWRTYSFVKVTTDDGLVGWSEYNEGWGFGGLTPVIETFGELLIGQDPQRTEAIASRLHLFSRASRGGILHGAVAAIEAALLDVKAKALGVPVCGLFGGPVRTKIPVYWTHCGTYRARHPKSLGIEPLRSLDDFVMVGREVRERGFKALKTNYLPFDGKNFGSFTPGTGRTPGYPELNYSHAVLEGMRNQLAALRDGAGPDIDIMFDTNFSFRTEGFIKVAKALESIDLTWLELDLYEPRGLALIRRESPSPIASCEHLFGRHDYRPFLENYSMDVAIIDVLWNGMVESVKVANMAEAFEVNCAVHNHYGPLGDLMAAHLMAAIPNFRIMELDVDVLPWTRELITHANVVEDGCFVLPDRPGWGAEINEEVLRAHPAKKRIKTSAEIGSERMVR